MKTFWQQFGALVTRLKDKVITDIFASARLRITLLYLLMGVLMLIVAGTLVYQHIIYIVQSAVQIFQSLLASGTPINQGLSEMVTMGVQGEVQRLIWALGIWMTLTMLVSAYILADITLRPIKRTLDGQKRFVANVSHELRTPLSIMKTQSEAVLLDEPNTTKEELLATLKSNMEEIDRMSRILQFLLNFSTVENKMKTLSTPNVPFSEVVKKSVDMMRAPAAKKNITIEMKESAQLTVNGNAVALEEMSLNLLKNAIRYTPEGGHVRVAVERKRFGIAMLTVSDTGVGIPPSDLPHIFEPFYKGKSVSTQRKDHAGLGLAIVKEIAIFHGGTVSVESAADTGTTFFVRIPIT